mmetsp:Transcript_14090/g.24159  ORF Transcript_14090/g.24159 Transcript_14090/m.24159 type:complete len:206 (+) Transcript_14090:112-729(+)
MSCADIVLDDYAYKQFDDPSYQGTRIKWDKVDFERRVCEHYKSALAVPTRDYPPLVDGYAPFCKHIFMANFAGALAAELPITPENRHLLCSGYKARRASELAVLVRWFPADKVSAPVAKYLDIILYSREQINKENAAMGAKQLAETAPWGIIAVKAQMVPYEIPMSPITMMRNALGVTEGGSGATLDREAYAKSVQYWEKHAIIG